MLCLIISTLRVYYLVADDVETLEYGGGSDTTEQNKSRSGDSENQAARQQQQQQREQEEEEGARDQRDAVMSASERSAAMAPPLQNHVTNAVLQQELKKLKEKFCDVPEDIVVKTLREVKCCKNLMRL